MIISVCDPVCCKNMCCASCYCTGGREAGEQQIHEGPCKQMLGQGHTLRLLDEAREEEHDQHPAPENQDSWHMIDQPRGSNYLIKINPRKCKQSRERKARDQGERSRITHRHSPAIFHCRPFRSLVAAKRLKKEEEVTTSLFEEVEGKAMFPLENNGFQEA